MLAFPSSLRTSRRLASALFPVWKALVPEPGPPPADCLDLVELAQATRIGEASSAGIMIASRAKMFSTDSIALLAAISALKQVGLAADTRRLAVEAAIAAGL